MKINKIETHWHSGDRVVFVTDDMHGIIEVQYPVEAPDVGYIWHLWVDNSCRRQGYATTLLDAAEKHIAKRGCTYAELDWDRRDTSKDILNWYNRQGYKEKEFNKHSVRLQKIITANKIK